MPQPRTSRINARNCDRSLSRGSATMKIFGRSKEARNTGASDRSSWRRMSSTVSRVGRRRQRQARHAGEARAQHAETAIFGPEMMAPLADAMGLIDREQRDRHLVEPLQRAFERQALGRDVEQLRAARHAGRATRSAPRPAAGPNAAPRRRHPAGAAPRPGLPSARSAGRRLSRRQAGTAPATGSTGSCRRRWASARRPSRPRSAWRTISSCRAAEPLMAEDAAEDLAAGPPGSSISRRYGSRRGDSRSAPLRREPARAGGCGCARAPRPRAPAGR